MSGNNNAGKSKESASGVNPVVLKLRIAGNIVWSTFRHPASTTTISSTTGKVLSNTRK